MKNNMITTINTSNENKDKNENEDDKTTTTLVSRTIFYRNVLTVIFLLLVTFALSRETINQYNNRNKNKNKNNKKVAVDDNNNDGIIGLNFVVGPYNHYDVNVFKLFSYQQRQYKNNKNSKNAVVDDENNDNDVIDRMLRGRGHGRDDGGVYFSHHGMGSRVRPTNTRSIHASSLTVNTSSKIPSMMLGHSPDTAAATTTTTTIKHHLDKNILDTATISFSFMDDNDDDDGDNKEDYFVRNRNKNRNKNDIYNDDTTSSGRRFPLLGQWFRQRFGSVASTSTSSSSLIKDDTKRRHRQLRDIIVNKSGNDRDDYGCINSAGYSWCESQKECIRVWNSTCDCVPSAGYVWCESTNECIRPWETTCPISTTASTSTSISTNSGMMILGNSNDDHNCLLSAGYFWCESINECIRSWETTCPTTTTTTTTTTTATTSTSTPTNSGMVLTNIEE